MGVFGELKRRNVFRVATVYVIVAWLVVQAADTISPALYLPAWFVSAITLFLILGFPVALVLAWAYAMTPEGLKREKEVAQDESITRITGRKLDFLIIGFLCVALAYFIFDQYFLEPSSNAELPAPVEDTSIAVLSFADFSPSGDQEYFCNGIAEELLNRMAAIPELSVRARASSFQFKGDGQDIVEIGTQLGVAYIIDGSVRKANDLLRITVKLVDANTGFHVWTQNYEESLSDVFALQDAISRDVVEELKPIFGLQSSLAPSTSRTTSLEAHEAFLRGREALARRTLSDVQRAVVELEKAVELDDEYAIAHAELAMAILLRRQFDVAKFQLVTALAEADPHIELALNLAPTLAEAHAAAGLRAMLKHELSEAAEYFERALEYNPSYAVAYLWLAGTHSRLGNYSNAISALRSAVQLDPLSGPAINNYTISLIQRERIDEASEELSKLATLGPARYVALIPLLGREGEWSSMALGSLDALLISPGARFAKEDLSELFAAMGLDAEAQAIATGPTVLSWIGRQSEALELARKTATRDGASLYARRLLGESLVAAGNYEDARIVLEELFAINGHRVSSGSYAIFGPRTAYMLMVARRELDRGADVSDILEALADDIERLRSAGIRRSSLSPGTNVKYMDGLTSYLAGNRHAGIEKIEEAVREGAFLPMNQVFLEELYSDPALKPAYDLQEARQARERSKFIEAVCSDNPYESVWQPSEMTCQQLVPEQ